MNTIKRISVVLLAVLIVFFTIISILAVWDIIQVENITGKSFTTILILFASSAVMLFLFSVVYPTNERNNHNNQGPNAPPHQ
ncbi:MAG: hypothetical protein V2A54_05930 [Bacteroidota bacterium]